MNRRLVIYSFTITTAITIIVVVPQRWRELFNGYVH